MASQAVHDFIDKVSKNDDVRKEVEGNRHGVADIAKKHGHDFTKEEFDQVMKEKSSKGQQPDWWCTG